MTCNSLHKIVPGTVIYCFFSLCMERAITILPDTKVGLGAATGKHEQQE